ncbi:extracellular solute-binding protein [Actinomadura violacea]|uniref:Extracellular solute-binding protein n=1 Tax=Actinomadura violacea TaxID=2819934 RepID=A0ABS3S3L9_9ACTN|nr:extracellular solute-binding protein [Actinomadura violacea]MBO2463610.1 extracellular solute-binding protein [Actinomadura violacea]
MPKHPPDRRTVLRYGLAALGAPLLAGCAQSTEIRVAGVDVTNLDAFTSANIDWRSEQGATLVLGAEQHPWITAMSPYLPQFEKLTGIKVSLQVSGEDQYVAKMPVVLAGHNSTPDVYMVWSYGQAVQSGWLEPLDSYLANANDPAWYDEQDVFASAKDYVRWRGGTTYGLAITAEAQVTFYRDDVIPDPAALGTFEGFQEAAVRAQESGKVSAGVALRGKPTGDAVAWPAAGYVFSHGGYLIDPGGRLAFDSPEAVAGVARYADIVKAACPKGVSTWSWLEITTAMQQAQVAMLQDSSNAALDIGDHDKSRVADHVRAAPFPAHNGVSKPNLYHWIIGINKRSRQKKAAWLFLLWATSRQGCTQIAARGGTPPRVSAWQNTHFQEIFGRQPAEAALKALRSADSKPVTLAWMHPKWPEIGDAFARAVNSVFTSGTSPHSALAEARSRLKGVL